MKLRIGSRGSALALWQAEHVKSLLTALDSSVQVDITVIHTTGDKITDVALSKIGDKGLFTKELDRAINEAQVDLAVHSLKDVPTALADGLELSAVLERVDPRDALVVAPGRPKSLRALPAGARIGTSSLRRRAQLLALRGDLVIEDLRGNLDTRLKRVADGRYDAALLAAAGLNRLGFADRVAQLLDPPEWLPAVGQGALGITTRADDRRTSDFVRQLEHSATRACTTAERSLLAVLEGGCQIPIGALGVMRGQLTLHALVASIDGREVVRGSRAGSPADAEDIGAALAADLLARGAQPILQALRPHT
ncbi:MAG TPA: hydroxymethylbilane synthase, partial [Longimicrobiales bacterium]|nr:hydroxymethylbilane synthase [Longimicrobiales bacterium]